MRLSPLVLALVAFQDADNRPFTDAFLVDEKDLGPTGVNPFFVLETGYQLVLEDAEDEEVLTITVLDETREIAGVLTRVVEERETEKGELKEVSRNYFAICGRTNSVYYFGEDVEIYRGGKLHNRKGAWLAGERGARYGLIMPGTPLLGARHYQEIAPGVAMDRAEIVDLATTLEVPAGRFEGVLKVEETTPLEPAEKDYKYYAPGVGMIRDGGSRLVRYGRRP